MSLEFSLNHTAPASADVDCVIVGAFADKQLTPAGTALDAASDGRLRTLLERGDISGKTGATALLHDVAGITAPRVLVIGLGESAKFGVAQYLKAEERAVDEEIEVLTAYGPFRRGGEPTEQE